MNRKQFLLQMAGYTVLSAGMANISSSEQSGAAFGKAQAKPALVVIDLQNVYMPSMADRDRTVALPVINSALSMFRSLNLPVYTIYHSDPVGGPTPGSAGFLYDPSIKLKDSDIRVVKSFPNSFKKTALLELLRKSGSNTLFLCGLSGTSCVLATYLAAQDLDFTAYLIRDAILSPNPGHTTCVEEICGAVTVSAIQRMFAHI